MGDVFYGTTWSNHYTPISMKTTSYPPVNMKGTVYTLEPLLNSPIVHAGEQTQVCLCLREHTYSGSASNEMFDILVSNITGGEEHRRHTVMDDTCQSTLTHKQAMANGFVVTIGMKPDQKSWLIQVA